MSATLSRTDCDGQTFTVTVNVSTSAAAAGKTYPITVRDQRDGDARTFTLTVRAAAPPTTTTAPPPPGSTVPPPPPSTAPPATEPPPPPTTDPPETTTTEAPATTTTVVVDPGAFASVESLAAQGIPEEGVFLPLEGAGYRECLPLNKPCADPDSALLLLPARDTSLAWAAPPEGATPLPQLSVRSVPPLQPVGTPPSDEPASSNYLLTMLDLADQGQLKSLPRGLNAGGELVAATADQQGVVVQPEDFSAPSGSRTFLASQPFGKPYRMKTAGLTEAAPAIPVFLASQPRVVYGVRTDPAWNVGADVIPLLGNGNVPYLVRGANGPPGLLVPIPPGVTLADGPATAEAAATADDEGSGFPIVAVLLAVVVIGGAAAAAFWFLRRRNTPPPPPPTPPSARDRRFGI
ncbi:MAG TPA: hypothetical protein VM345_02565 [Acidimicrobiales bacterium]|nr:hypothetical protein [Acidimicrobiales bacterium]